MSEIIAAVTSTSYSRFGYKARATMRFILMLVVLSLIAFWISGCVAHGGAPRSSNDIEKERDYFSSTEYEYTEMFKRYMQAQDDPGEQEKIRNKYIDARLSLINTNYKAFVNQVNKEKQSLDTGAGIGALISDLVVSVTPAASTKTIWGAVSAGLTGTQLTINENIYYQKTISALLAAMDAGRAKARLAIEEGKRRGVNEYGLVDANIDLNAYEAAGSFLKALENIQTDADRKADEYESKITTVKFRPGDEPLKKRIRAWIDKDPDNERTLREWLDKKRPPPDSRLPAIWVESAPTDELKAAIVELKIPETQTPTP